MAVEKAFPTMFANFRRWNGSLFWMEDCSDSLLAVFDVLSTNERQSYIDQGLPFDETDYLHQEFSSEEVAHLLPKITERAMDAKKGKGKMAEGGSSSAVETVAAITSAPVMIPIEPATSASHPATSQVAVESIPLFLLLRIQPSFSRAQRSRKQRRPASRRAPDRRPMKRPTHGYDGRRVSLG